MVGYGRWRRESTHCRAPPSPPPSPPPLCVIKIFNARLSSIYGPDQGRQPRLPSQRLCDHCTLTSSMPCLYRRRPGVEGGGKKRGTGEREERLDRHQIALR